MPLQIVCKYSNKCVFKLIFFSFYLIVEKFPYFCAIFRNKNFSKLWLFNAFNQFICSLPLF